MSVAPFLLLSSLQPALPCSVLSLHSLPYSGFVLKYAMYIGPVLRGKKDAVCKVHGVEADTCSEQMKTANRLQSSEVPLAWFQQYFVFTLGKEMSVCVQSVSHAAAYFLQV